MKGVIVAAGYGSRFLPITKTIPKEMLPIYDRPAIDFILDEFEEAGIKDVIIITSRRKKVLEDYLDREIELEDFFNKNGKEKYAELIKPRNMNFYFVRQKEMKGTGDALLLLKSIISEEAFIVAYPDDLVLSSPGLSKRLIDEYGKTGKSILAVRKEIENLSRYGVIKPRKEKDVIYVEKIVEKPSIESAPSNFVSIGRYLFTSELLLLLEEDYKNHKEGEFYHINAINRLAKDNKVIALEIEGTMLDTGELESYTLSVLNYLNTRKDGKKILEKFIDNFKKSL
ncbi:MAG: UTP--glucose-1-phosphate uridylyltransferase [Brevinematales bacterium]|nr:UTP--glucose-1-phosphate uridylyltransferase [Brevinematales bacterium]